MLRPSSHIDAHNLNMTKNLTCALGTFSGGELWLEMCELDDGAPRQVHWETKENGKRVPGHLHSTWRSPLSSLTRSDITVPALGRACDGL